MLHSHSASSSSRSNAGVSRRDFLRTSAFATVALSVPTILPSSVFGQDAPGNRITLGIIGCGNQSTLGLWFWDVSSHGRMLGDWQAWRDKVQGRALLRDTFDYGLGSREVIEYEAGRGEFEIERDDPGILILRRK